MNAPAQKQECKTITAAQLTPELLTEALHTAKRYDRNLASKEGSEVFPVPTRIARLMALAIIYLHDKAGLTDAAKAKQDAEDAKYNAELAAGKGKQPPAKKAAAPAKAKKKEPSTTLEFSALQMAADAAQTAYDNAHLQGPTMTPEQAKAYKIIKGAVEEKQVVTTRLVSERGGWASHNTGARHIKNLIDLGYLKKVGRQQRLALTALRP